MSQGLEEQFATNVYYDRTFDCEAAKILPGEYFLLIAT
jgi:chemotaxis protein CheD